MRLQDRDKLVRGKDPDLRIIPAGQCLLPADLLGHRPCNGLIVDHDPAVSKGSVDMRQNVVLVLHFLLVGLIVDPDRICVIKVSAVAYLPRSVAGRVYRDLPVHKADTAPEGQVDRVVVLIVVRVEVTHGIGGQFPAVGGDKVVVQSIDDPVPDALPGIALCQDDKVVLAKPGSKIVREHPLEDFCKGQEQRISCRESVLRIEGTHPRKVIVEDVSIAVQGIPLHALRCPLKKVLAVEQSRLIVHPVHVQEAVVAPYLLKAGGQDDAERQKCADKAEGQVNHVALKDVRWFGDITAGNEYSGPEEKIQEHMPGHVQDQDRHRGEKQKVAQSPALGVENRVGKQSYQHHRGLEQVQKGGGVMKRTPALLTAEKKPAEKSGNKTDQHLVDDHDRKRGAVALVQDIQCDDDNADAGVEIQRLLIAGTDLVPALLQIGRKKPLDEFPDHLLHKHHSKRKTFPCIIAREGEGNN